MAAPVAVETSYGAPRTLLFVTVKRDNPGWRDLYGHWWVEVGEESYGWWPATVPLGVRDVLHGTGGVLNGMGLLHRSGTWHRDAQHGRDAAHAFHPVLILPLSDVEVRSRLRAFAHAYRGGWRWGWTAGAARDTCRSFQDGLLASAGLQVGLQHLASRGKGCLFLYRPRTALWWMQDAVQGAGRVRPVFEGRPGSACSRSMAARSEVSSSSSRAVRLRGLAAFLMPHSHHPTRAKVPNHAVRTNRS